MELISASRRIEVLFGEPAQEIRKLELWDFYEVDRQLFDAWRSGDRKTVEETMKGHLKARAGRLARGFPFRRVRVVSEPLSEYQRMAVEIAHPEELLRWLPRSKVSATPLPGNDCLIRDDLVVFNLIGGDGRQAEIQLSTDQDVVRFCNEAFSRAWSLGIPNGEYNP
ncbi:hypothetical protein DP939_24605 [Spongiactinospora rosea]|uniref:DUF6879 domain-containing protein n=1 Tax=Spongiactinospora rosea TaxID=2248750 RepID=A0A366LUB0_9ACTN|nr:DUF6879 family protein [Spongiactinospora rosea]RBQ17546.1 hypothetical protein DP939_24605 [Spongiactinospora rosea]